MAKKEYRDKVIIKRRMLFVFSMLSVLFFALIIRLVFIMIVNSNRLKDLATEQWTSEVKIDAKRGRILDRNGVDLAMSANVYRVDLDMNTIRQYLEKKKQKYEDIAPLLAQALNMDTSKVLAELNKKLPSGRDRQSGTLARRVEKTVADKVSALKISGVMVSPDTKRYYPNEYFLAHVLGSTDADGNGLTGVELIYNDVLKGIPGVRIAETDSRSSELPYIISEFTKPVDGKDVVLTIEEKIQYFAEKAAQQALTDNKAKAVSIIVSDPKTGEILAMANKPDFNPNTIRENATTYEEINKAFRNRAVNDTYEPGSIFKIVTSVAAMEEGLVKENDQFVCNGSKTVANKNIHCWKTSGHGLQNFVDILKNSCNVGFMELGERVGKEKLNEYIKKLGFGQKTNIDLNGEAKGIIKPTDKISTVDLATISFGQTNTITPIQFVAAFNSVANGGYWITPHVMKEITYVDENGQTVVQDKFEKSKNYTKKQVISEKTAKQLSQYLEKVVSEGGGKKAFIEGYHIAGKTGTAQKVVNGVYEKGKYVASFTGMAPANDPKISVFISIDEPDPSNYYAGQIATPVAQQVFNDIFNYYSFNVDATDAKVAESLLKDVVIPNVRGMKKEEAIKALKSQNITARFDGDTNGNVIVDMSPKPGVKIKEGKEIILYTGSSSSQTKEIVVPDLKGYNKDKATQLLESIGLKAKFSGEGLVAEQSIEPNEIVTKGTIIDIELDNTAGD